MSIHKVTSGDSVTENFPPFLPSLSPPPLQPRSTLSHFLPQEEQLFLRFRPSGQLSTSGAEEASAGRALDSWEQLQVPGEPLPPQSQRSRHADRRNVAASLTLVDAACSQMSLGNHS